MITTLAAYDVTVSSWLLHAFSTMIGDPFYALAIICLITALLFFVVGKLWGMAWNKKWKLSGSRFLTIGFISLLGGVSLAAVNGLYGGKFFQVEVSEAMEAIHSEGSVKYVDIKSADYGYSAAKPLIDAIQVSIAETDEEKEKIAKGEPILVTIEEKVVAPYFTALNILLTTFWVIVAVLVAGVAWFAYKDIKVKEAYNI